MELKKCVRCGCFFSSANDVCSNCEAKDKQDIYKLNNYIENCDEKCSIDDLAYNTGVTMQNINRFIENKNINIL